MVLQTSLGTYLTDNFSLKFLHRYRRPVFSRSRALAVHDALTVPEPVGSKSSAPSLWSTTQAVSTRLSSLWSMVVETQRSLAQPTVLGKQSVRIAQALVDEVEDALIIAHPPSRSLAKFVRPATSMELAQAHLMADLSNKAYDVAVVTHEMLLQEHKLHLVAKSAVCDAESTHSADSWLMGDELASQAPVALAHGARSAVVGLTSSNIVPFVLDKEGKRSSDGRYECCELVADQQDCEGRGWGYQIVDKFPASTVARECLRQSSQLETTASGGNQPDGQETPTNWFICDDPVSNTRFIVLQGSVNLNHWLINLRIDPVPFVDESTGVKVHRGFYEAAVQMYDQLLPYVRAHIAAYPHSRVAFTGHSLGGSLATILMLLFVKNGVLPPACVFPVHSFGAPAVFCHSAGECGMPCYACGLVCATTAPKAPVECSAHRGLLQQLGLQPNNIINVIMHRDIVPRAFVCDYSSVAYLLKRFNPSFHGHTGLADHHHHKVLYNFLGQVEVLQPDVGQEFMDRHEMHEMLPRSPQLYKLVEPQKDYLLVEEDEEDTLTLEDTVLAFMNCPHPLETLADPKAYGSAGSVSRFHNPENYAKALSALMRFKSLGM